MGRKGHSQRQCSVGLSLCAVRGSATSLPDMGMNLNFLFPVGSGCNRSAKDEKQCDTAKLSSRLQKRVLDGKLQIQGNIRQEPSAFGCSVLSTGQDVLLVSQGS